MRVLIAMIILAALAVALDDSQARAGLLKNSVRVGDRSKMTIVKTPTPGQQVRIRIAPPVQSPSVRQPEPSFAWFWEEHSTDADSAAPERWTAALDSLRLRRANGEGLYTEERLREIAETYSDIINEASNVHGVSQLLLVAVIAVESAGQSHAISTKGARGLMQLIPATARRFGVGNSFDPGQNVMGGAAYLSWLLNRFAGDPILALAGYNSGEGAVEKFRGVPPYAETRDYVVRVFDALSGAEALCTRPAVTPRDRCRLPTAVAANPDAEG